MSVKLLMKWDIKQEQQQEYFEFVVREWGPGLNRLGVELIGLWLTTYTRDGETQQIMAEGLTEDMVSMRKILGSAEWQRLHDKLLECVTNYSQKVVRTSGEFQL
jgi:hypothetical protein